MEIWKVIVDNDYYHVSNLGRVKSIERKVPRSTSGEVSVQQRILKQGRDGSGYPQVGLTKNKSKKTYKVHRLVANAFIDNNESKLEVNHINGVKADNRVENLEWCTRGENISHAYKNGLRCSKGVNNPSSKLNETNVKNILKLLDRGVTAKKIAKAFFVAESTIGRIKNGQIWNHITNGVKRQAK
jgi:hypothetical protein